MLMIQCFYKCREEYEPTNQSKFDSWLLTWINIKGTESFS